MQKTIAKILTIIKNLKLFILCMKFTIKSVRVWEMNKTLMKDGTVKHSLTFSALSFLDLTKYRKKKRLVSNSILVMFRTEKIK